MYVCNMFKLELHNTRIASATTKIVSSHKFEKWQQNNRFVLERRKMSYESAELFEMFCLQFPAMTVPKKNMKEMEEKAHK